MTIARRRRRLNDPNLRDRLYELLEHDQLPYSIGSRFAQLIVCIIIIDVLAMVLASVPEFDVHFGTLFTAVKIGAAMVFALEYAARSGARPATRRGNCRRYRTASNMPSQASASSISWHFCRRRSR